MVSMFILSSLKAKPRPVEGRGVCRFVYRSTATITVEVHSLSELRLIINRLSAIHGVYRVARVGSAEAKADYDKNQLAQ